MLNTKIKKILATVALSSMLIANTSATNIGTGSVTSSGAFDTPIVWNDIFGTWSSASGSVTNIKIKARVLPTLNMEISAEEIDLGDLIAWVSSTWSLQIEIGTNAVTWVSITARSQSWGLTNLSDWTTQLNNLLTDGVAEIYKYSSIKNTSNDSSYTMLTTDLSGGANVFDTAEHTIYTSDKPEATTSVDDVEFIVEVETTAETPAWEYEDHVTFTVTANF